MNDSNSSIVFVACVAFRGSEDLLSPEGRKDIEDTCALALLLEEIFFWVSVVLGVPGNLVAAVTILSLKLTPATFYLVLLAFGDFISLVFTILTKFFKDYSVITTEDVSHDWFYNLHHYAGTYANWTLVLICLERLAIILDPFRKTVNLTLRHAYMTAAVLCVALTGAYVLVSEMESYGSKTWIIVYTTCYNFIPLPVVFITSGVIAIELRRGLKRRGFMSEIQVRQIARQDNAMTVIMLTASFAFAVLTTPLCIVMLLFLIQSYTWLSPHHFPSADFFLALRVSIGLSQLTHGVNVYLYFVSVKRFREQFVYLFSCKTILKPTSQVFSTQT
ncbi:uncharacterized protein LOC101864546 [Aplysia californica]|uniref:Uncharacterized protein LOC101864546 n=1 Tax=Aplysia californica TaxID=6500 RepID=A0ABM0K102_APLCA|nr:uncharacterized protein LOC101864546 [Aplysia californica]